MKLLSLLLVLSVTVRFSSAQELSKSELSQAMKKTQKERVEKNKRFLKPESSPLDKDSIEFFHGLKYFEINPDFIFNASFVRIDNGKEFEMLTNTDRKPLYVDYALVSFQYDGKRHTLHAYQNVEYAKSKDYDNTLFIPFNDFTNGLTTYGGGRYLDIEIPKSSRLILNFNNAYNPYCGYNPKYSCPIPPEENKINASITAGEVKYH